jgi:MFS family permease
VAAIEDDTLLDERSAAEQTLLDERRRRPQAAGAAFAAGVLTMGGATLSLWVNRDRPRVDVLGALGERFAAPPPQPGLKARQVLWYDDNALWLLVAALVLALAAAAMGFALSHLYRSVKARRPDLPIYVRYAVACGAGLAAVSGIVQAIGLVAEAAAFADSPAQTSNAAREVLQSPIVLAAGVLSLFGVFALGLAFVLLALNGMRVGLLTRFMGVLGILVGVLFIIPIGSSLPIVQAFWLSSLGVLFLGRWPSGMPPAWVTGEAQPWPTQQELREARMEAPAEPAGDEIEERPRRGERRRERAEAPETPAPELPARRPHPSSKKRKRKRR